jgi:alkylation response protein AidB-like acyl-CoA dehydrogenase
MKSILTREQTYLYQGFKEYVSRYVDQEAAGWDLEQGVSPEAISHLSKEGYLGAMIPEVYGGKGWDLITYGLLNEAFGKSSSSLTVLFTVQNMVSSVLMKWGSGKQVEKWLEPIAKGEVLAAFALTEPNVGSDIGNVEANFTKEEDVYILNGTKKWITFAGMADLFLVFGQCEGQTIAAFIEKDTPGFTVTRINNMLGFRGCYLGKLDFENVIIPRENIVGKQGFGISLIAPYGLHYGRLSTAFSSLGLMRGCLELASDHALNRKSAGTTLINHGMIAEKIADMGVNYDAAFHLCVDAARADEKGLPNVMEQMIAAKYFASRKSVAAATDTVQILGAMGCHEESTPAGRFYRDAKIMEIIEGTNQVLQHVLGQTYAKRFKSKTMKMHTAETI